MSVKQVRYSSTVCLAMLLAGLIELKFATASESEEELEISDLVSQFLGIIELNS